jgi:hypothetical protein
LSKLMRRIEKLEGRAGIGAQPGIQLILMRAGQQLALDSDRCVEILKESGFLRDGPWCSSLDFGNIPDGLNANELEKYHREHGEQICGGAPSRGQAAGPVAV